MKRVLFSLSFNRHLAGTLVLLGWANFAVHSASAFVETGGIAHNFTLKNRKTGQPVNLADFEGKIVFLDMFAYW